MSPIPSKEPRSVLPSDWRQGVILGAEAIDRIREDNHDLDDSVQMIVVSHDCDIAASLDLEPSVEILVARCVEQPQRMYRHLRNPRILDLSARRMGKDVFLRARIRDRIMVAKERLMDLKPSLETSLPRDETNVLIRWLARRYSRTALPSAFNDRLQAVDKRLNRLFKRVEWKPVSSVLVQTTFEELLDDEVYPLTVWLVVAPAALQNRDTKRDIDNLAEKLSEILMDCPGIALKELFVLGEDEVTLADMRRLEVLDFDYRSLSQDPPGEMGDPAGT